MDAKDWFITLIIVCILVITGTVVYHNAQIEREKEIAGPHYP